VTAEEAREHLALAADLPLLEAEALYARAAAFLGTVKVGLSLYVEHGPAAVRAFTRRGARVFLDLKLHDIPNTVKLAARVAAELGVSLLTVHAQGGGEMLRAAVAGAREGAGSRGLTPPRILAVTVLTSLSDAALLEMVGQPTPASQYAVRLARFAIGAGADGLVCSPLEARELRASLPPDVFLCTPGIRPAGVERGDQARAETPSFAVRSGSDLLVVGRAIYAAADPVEAARAVHEEVCSA
jgi:orotidine-5'-phosphate decarboxylase